MSEKVLIWLLFEQEGAVLLTRRKNDEPPFAGQWVLPGDIMEIEESASETVQRFGREELDVRVGAEEFIDTFYLTERETSYAVTVFKAVSFEGHLHYRESGPYAEARWCLPADLPSPIPEALAEMLGGKRHWRSDDEEPAAGSTI
ncbi:MAG: NUDIX hydrolase [Dehalococcoidia bacterium]